MKKITLLFTIILFCAGGVRAAEYVAFQPTSPVTLNSSYAYDTYSNSSDGTFTTLSNGDIIKIHITNVASGAYYSLQYKTGNDWTWTDLVSSTAIPDNGVITYTVASEEIATLIKQRGLVVKADNSNSYKLLDITVETNYMASTSHTVVSSLTHDLGNWNNSYSLSSFDFSTTKNGDKLVLNWTSYSTLGEGAWATIQLQDNSGTNLGGEGINTTSTEHTTTITITDAILAHLQGGTAKINGGNLYLNSVSIASNNATYTETVYSTETYFGNWGGYYNITSANAESLSKGDVLNIAYVVPEGYSDGGIVLRNTNNSYAELYKIQNLSGTGTLHFVVTEQLLSLLQAGYVNITGFGGGGTNSDANGVKMTSISCSYFKGTTNHYRPVYIPAGGYATFYGASTCALPDGVTAYYVSSTDENKAYMTSVSNIPANQGVILKGATGIYQLYTTTDAAASVTDNKLVGATTRTQINETANKYVLYDNSGSPEFRTITTSSYLDAYKCYLSTTTSGSAPLLTFDFGSHTTSIKNIGHTTIDNNRIYNLRGQEIKIPSHGIYIKNGKKVIIK